MRPGSERIVGHSEFGPKERGGKLERGWRHGTDRSVIQHYRYLFSVVFGGVSLRFPLLSPDCLLFWSMSKWIDQLPHISRRHIRVVEQTIGRGPLIGQVVRTK